MREIKFRAWDERKQRMHYNNLHKTVWVGGKEASVNTDEGQLAGNFIPMQYTGFKDKNEKQIWEGDIVWCKLNRGHKGGNYAVTWSDICAHWIVYATELYQAKNIEVIGNIYENAELLTK